MTQEVRPWKRLGEGEDRARYEFGSFGGHGCQDKLMSFQILMNVIGDCSLTFYIW